MTNLFPNINNIFPVRMYERFHSSKNRFNTQNLCRFINKNFCCIKYVRRRRTNVRNTHACHHKTSKTVPKSISNEFLMKHQIKIETELNHIYGAWCLEHIFLINVYTFIFFVQKRKLRYLCVLIFSTTRQSSIGVWVKKNLSLLF